MAWGSDWKTPSVWPKVGEGGYTVDVIKDFKLTDTVNMDERLANKFPTHDPYTNPGAFLYYECNCGQVLDPKVKSFASLNNAAMNAGWKVRWGPNSYVPYCVKCGEGVE